jgi:hypothetical protein
MLRGIHSFMLQSGRKNSQAPLVHAYNHIYSGGSDQEDCSWKPAGENSFLRPYLEKLFTKIGVVEWLKVKALSSSPSTTKIRKRKKREITHLNCCFMTQSIHDTMLLRMVMSKQREGGLSI